MDLDIANDKKNNENYNFKPDEVFKYLFTNLSNKTRINLLNTIFNIKLEEDTEIEIVNTENVILDLIKNEFKNTRSDVILDLKYKRKIHLEFQSTKDKEMGLRVFLYGLGLAMSEKGVKNNILKFPLSHVLYTVLYGKPMYGEDVIMLDVPNCKIENKYYEDCRIEISIKYTNLLSFSLEDFSNKNLEILAFIYLYRYIKAKKEHKPKEKDIKRILSEMDIITKISDTLPDADREKLIIPITNLVQDVSDIISKNVKNKEMISMLQERVKTYAEKIRDEAIQEERLKIEKERREERLKIEKERQEERLKIKKEREEQVKNMLDMHMDLSVVSKLTKLSEEEILAIQKKVNKMDLF